MMNKTIIILLGLALVMTPFFFIVGIIDTLKVFGILLSIVVGLYIIFNSLMN